MATQQIQHQLILHNHLRQRLREDFPEADDETLDDTLEGISALSDQLAEIVRAALEDEAFHGDLKLRLGEMREANERAIEANGTGSDNSWTTSDPRVRQLSQIFQTCLSIKKRDSPNTGPRTVSDQSNLFRRVPRNRGIGCGVVWARIGRPFQSLPCRRR